MGLLTALMVHGLMDFAAASNSTNNSTDNASDNSTGDDMISGSASMSLGPLAAACVAVLFLANLAAASNSTGNSTGDDMLSGSGTAWLGSFVASCVVAALVMS